MSTGRAYPRGNAPLTPATSWGRVVDVTDRQLAITRNPKPRWPLVKWELAEWLALVSALYSIIQPNDLFGINI